MHRQKKIRTMRGMRMARVSRDYPWHVLTAVWKDCSTWLPTSDNELISRVIRTRDILTLKQLGEAWGLQCTPPRRGDNLIYIDKIRLLLGAVVKKFQFSGNAQERRNVAIQSLYSGKRSCSEFNTRGYKRLFLDGQPSQFLQLMQEFVEKTIGYFPPEWDQLTKWSRHGPGSDLCTYKGRNSSYFKYQEWPYSVTEHALGYARRLISNDERWLGALEQSYRERNLIPSWCILDQKKFWSDIFKIVPGNRVTTVPKDGFKDRPIAIEPRLNLMLQLGVDGFVRRRLKRWGIDLDLGWLKNQKLAYDGSVRHDADAPCTLDLSNASDSVSLRIVKLLFPKPWFQYLCEIRSPLGKLPNGQKLRYSKLSSMGNGYTFAIESLVFAACLYAASKYTYGSWLRDDHAVFGDDLVCPSAEVPLVRMLLETCGFTINQDKSFDSSRPGVRESCGTDWIQGHLVRPVHITQYPRDVRDIYSARNRLHRWFRLHLGTDTPNIDSYHLRYLPDGILSGPLSDTEFDTYWHTSEPGDFHHSVYRYRAVTTIPIPQKGRELAFRKLMHPLRPLDIVPRDQWIHDSAVKRFKESLGLLGDETPENPWDAKSHGGSVFLVTRRNKERLTVSTRLVHHWTDEYCLPTLSGTP